MPDVELFVLPNILPNTLSDPVALSLVPTKGIFTDTRLLHPLNDPIPISDTLPGITSFVNP